MLSLQNLTEKQKEAVLSESRRLLVLAGAGSGKTKTLIQKLLYLMEQKGEKPSNMLAITFTKNATNEMVDRLIMASDDGSYDKFINNKSVSKSEKDQERLRRKGAKPSISNLTIKTFHSLCYNILRNSGGVSFDNKFRLLIDESTSDLNDEGSNNIAQEKPWDIMHKTLISLSKDRLYLLKLKRYILDYYVDRSFIDQEIKSRQYANQISYTTFKGDKVKSKSERDIADWLFRHSIKYTYEPVVNFKDYNFRPDFFIPQANLYLEHISDKSYTSAGKDEQFLSAGKTCVKTYERMCQDTALFNLEMERIVQSRIDTSQSEIVALKYEEEFKSYGDKVKEFLKVAIRVQSLVKAEDFSYEELSARSQSSQHERIRVFYELVIPILRAYEKYCVEKSYLDFDDLIIQTIRLLSNNPEIRESYQEKFRFIMVDEFQDVNSLQVKLLHLLLKPDTKLFCVGDDWQSIYGFRGSEVDYIVNFERHFENADIIHLDVNFRSTESIVGASTEVIRKNKFQINKEIKAYKRTPSKIEIYRAREKDKDDVNFLVEKIQELQANGYTQEDILILYRRSNMYNPYREVLRSMGLKVTSKTIHASKGLEAKAVFIIGLTEGKSGFPDIWLDDAVFRVIKDVRVDMLLEEERRLFYVALTRAKDELFLMTELGNESQFIQEIPKEFCIQPAPGFNSVVNFIPVCEQCKTEIKEYFNYCPTCGVVLPKVVINS